MEQFVYICLSYSSTSLYQEKQGMSSMDDTVNNNSGTNNITDNKPVDKAPPDGHRKGIGNGENGNITNGSVHKNKDVKDLSNGQSKAPKSATQITSNPWKFNAVDLDVKRKSSFNNSDKNIEKPKISRLFQQIRERTSSDAKYRPRSNTQVTRRITIGAPVAGMRRATWDPKMSGKRLKKPQLEACKSIPEVTEEARHVLEQFLQRSLSQNDVSPIKEYRHMGELEVLRERRDSEDAHNLAADEAAKPRGKAHTVGAADYQNNIHLRERKSSSTKTKNTLAVKQQYQRAGTPDSIASFYDDSDEKRVRHGSFTSGNESSDDDQQETVGKKKKKKNFFRKARERIQESFRRERNFSISKRFRNKDTNTSDRAPPLAQFIAHGPPAINVQSPSTKSSSTSKSSDLPNYTTPPSSADILSESDKLPLVSSDSGVKDPQVLAEALDEVTMHEPRTNHSPVEDDGFFLTVWRKLRGSQKKKKGKPRSHSLNSSAAVTDTFGEALTYEGHETISSSTTSRSRSNSLGRNERTSVKIGKTHSFRGRCSLAERQSLVLEGLVKSRPKQADEPKSESGKRRRPAPDMLNHDVEADGLDEDDNGLDDELRERTEEEKEEVYDRVAQKLAEIADSLNQSSPVNEQPSPDGAVGGRPNISSVEAKLAEILRDRGDTLNSEGLIPTEAIAAIVKHASYKKFKKVVKTYLIGEPSAQQIAMLFTISKMAIQAAGSTGNIAIQIKDLTLRYFEDKFAGWIIGQGGWDSMLEDSDDEERGTQV